MFVVDNEERHFRGTLAYVSADNLGAQYIGGFKQAWINSTWGPWLLRIAGPLDPTLHFEKIPAIKSVIKH